MHQHAVCKDCTVVAVHGFYLVDAVLTEVDGYDVVAIDSYIGHTGSVGNGPAQRY